MEILRFIDEDTAHEAHRHVGILGFIDEDTAHEAHRLEWGYCALLMRILHIRHIAAIVDTALYKMRILHNWHIGAMRETVPQL